MEETTEDTVRPDLRYRPPVFDGDEGGWSEWCFRFRAFAADISPDMDAMLDRVQNSASRVELADLTPPQVVLAKKLMNLLIRSTSGPPFLTLRSVEQGNGFEGWRSLHLRYESSASSRQLALLSAVLKPPPFG